MSTIAVIGGYGMKTNGVRNSYSLQSRQKWLKSCLPFSLEEYEGRIERVKAMLKKNDLDAVIVHGDSNENGYVRWMSNFSPLYGSSYIVIPSDGDTTLVSDSVLHGEPMHSLWWSTWLDDVRPTRHSIDGLMQGLGQVLHEKHLASKESKLGWVGDYGFPEERVKSTADGASLANINE